MEKILVTGHKGFIASRLTARLVGMDYEVEGYDVVDGDDLLNLKAITEVVERNDIVFHIAAEADLTRMAKSTEAGFNGVRANVEATNNIALTCAQHGKWLLFASTVCVYGNVDEHPELEDKTLPNASELYACSKYAAEWLIRGYGLNYSMPWTILRFATIYGEGMRNALGLYIFFRQTLSGEPITVHGDGTQNRVLTYVEDLVDGIVAPLARRSEAQGQIFNLCSPESISAIKAAQDVAKILEVHEGRSSQIVHIEQRKNQTQHEEVDVSKAERLLGWKAKTSWDEGLLRTYCWMKTQI